MPSHVERLRSSLTRHLEGAEVVQLASSLWKSGTSTVPSIPRGWLRWPLSRSPVITDTIPSSLTLTVLANIECRCCPTGRTHCTSVVFPQAARTDAYQAVREAVDEGRQAFVVFPVGESGDLLGPDDALRYAQALQSEALEGARIGVYCSAMSREDRVRVFEDFQHRRIDVLVATTFIEEAPVVANATVVVVEHADHHELARLHRLRGHVGQGLEPAVLDGHVLRSPAKIPRRG